MAESRRFTIGYALAPKKQRSFIQPSLVGLSKGRGIDLVPIDPSLPLLGQGPFDCVLHKLYGDDWKRQLREFSAENPGVPVIDRPSAIERLHNRISMLQAVSELEIPQGSPDTFGIPSQVVVYDSNALSDSRAVGALRFPVIAKPLVADGSAKSHKMSLVYHRAGLLKLRPPLVLQEFVNHGGVIFKVYVVGGHVRCVKRKSLPDVPEEKLESAEEGSMAFSQVSNLTHREEEHYYEQLEDAELPPLRFVTDIAVGLRRVTGLHLFNFDMIRDVKAGNHYFVIDINYFPGYAKMPNYEAVLTEFFWDVVTKKAAENEEAGGKYDDDDGDEKKGEKTHPP